MVKRQRLPEPPRPQTRQRKTGAPEKNIFVIATGGTLCMKPNAEGCYEPVADYIPELLRGTRALHDKVYYEEHVAGRVRSEHTLVLPEVKGFEARVVYTIHEYFPLIDSSNMQISDYRKIAHDIFENYEAYDGFVILHGTDTLAYTASNLSFMLENLGKPVILTGAQVPAAEMRSDAFDNIQGSLVCAGLYDVPEVAIFFNRKLFRGNRTEKVNADEFDAFNSPNLDPLIKMGINIQVNSHAILTNTSSQAFKVTENWNTRVALLRLFPAITSKTVRTFLENVDGIVIQTYGAGNGPSERADILEELRRAAEKGVIIVNVTQCQRGSVSSAYAAGRELEKAGVIGGYDMTVEAALAKLSYICGMTNKSTHERQVLIAKSLRGELTRPDPVNNNLAKLMSGIQLLLSDPNVKNKDSAQNTILAVLLCQAAKQGNLATLQGLRNAGAPYTSTDFDQRTPLHIAAAAGHLHIAKELVANDVNINAEDRNKQTPLDLAAEACHLEVITFLVRKGCRLASKTAATFKLCSFAALNNLAAVKALIRAGADPNMGGYDGRTVLHVAVENGRKSMCEFLVDNGARGDVCDKNGNDCLYYARLRGHKAIAKLLSETAAVHVAKDVLFGDNFRHFDRQTTVAMLKLLGERGNKGLNN